MYYRYPRRALMFDYLRASVGFVFVAVPLVLGRPGTFFFVVLGALAALFFVYGLRTLNMHMTAYELRPDGVIVHGPVRRYFLWQQMSALRLRYFSTQRDKRRRNLKTGWMELKLYGPSGRLRIDSELQGFGDILEAAATAAERRGLPLDDDTAENVKAFRAGDVPPPPPERGVGERDLRF